MHVRCPHCHNIIEVVEESSFADVECSSCGSNFNLIGDSTHEFRPLQRKLGQFTLLDCIGVGAFGTVYKAHDETLDRTVAIKIPRNEQMGPEEREMFFREARATAQLNHPNIVSVHEVGREGDTVYIVSDLVEGITLQSWLTANRYCGNACRCVPYCETETNPSLLISTAKDLESAVQINSNERTAHGAGTP